MSNVLTLAYCIYKFIKEREEHKRDQYLLHVEKGRATHLFLPRASFFSRFGLISLSLKLSPTQIIITMPSILSSRKSL